MKCTQLVAALAVTLGLAQAASAAFIVETRSGGVGFANFGFGPSTTSASTSTATSAAVGITPAIGSIFGGDAPSGTTTPTPDAYTYKYTPSANADNKSFAVGTPLNSTGQLAFGNTGGGAGPYRIYATWPFTTNISAGNSPTNYVLNDGTSNVLSTSLNQNAALSEWHLLGEVVLDPAKTYTLTQTNTQVVTVDPFGGPSTFTNGFVSMRASAVLFQLVPEPSGVALGLLSAVGMLGAAWRGVKR